MVTETQCKLFLRPNSILVRSMDKSGSKCSSEAADVTGGTEWKNSFWFEFVSIEWIVFPLEILFWSKWNLHWAMWNVCPLNPFTSRAVGKWVIRLVITFEGRHFWGGIGSLDLELCDKESDFCGGKKSRVKLNWPSLREEEGANGKYFLGSKIA